MDHKNYIAADRISELPDHLQQHILSSLSINEVVQSPILSKRWKHVWTAVPVLGFNTILFGSTDHKKNLDVKSKDDSNQASNRCKPKAREQGSSQRNVTQISWISPELLETIESIPYHEHFIHMHDGSLPRG